MTTPYLLIDVDGVLNPFPDEAGHRPETHTLYHVVPTGYDPNDPVPIWLNPDHGPMITRLINTRLLTPVWSTTWQQDANTLIGARLGLPTIPFIEWDRPTITTSHPNGYLWKRDPVSAWIGNTPVAWIDDDFTALDHEWAAKRDALGVPTLLIQPDPKAGLLPDHLDRIRTWAETLNGRSPTAAYDEPA